MPFESTILTSALSDPLRSIANRGGDARRLLLASGLEAKQLAEPVLVIPLGVFVNLSQNAARDLAAPEFGWRTGAGFNLTNLGAVGRTMLRAPTLHMALNAVCEAFRAVQGNSLLELDTKGGTAVLRYQILDPNIWPRSQDAELTLSVFARLIALAAGRGWRPRALFFEHSAPPVRRNDQAWARERVRYNAACNELRFEANLLTQPMPTHEKGAWRHDLAEARRLTQEVEQMVSLPGQVRQHILARLGNDCVAQDSIAREMGISTRGLRRRLSDHGTCFSEVLGQCRISVARHRLIHSNRPVIEISADLGYSDQTAFERAFRRTEGLTPTQFRASGLKKAAD